MTVDQLVAFERVAREGSFSRAAVALGLGQPAVSARILALEDELGGSLFVRARSIRLTGLGTSLLPYVRRALEVLREGVEAARLAQVGQRGSIRVGALGSLAGGLVGPALAEFLRAHPRVECTLKAANHEVLLQYLLDGLDEVALGTLAEIRVSGMAPLFRDSALVRRRHSGPISPALAAFIQLLRARAGPLSADPVEQRVRPPPSRRRSLPRSRG